MGNEDADGCNCASFANESDVVTPFADMLKFNSLFPISTRGFLSNPSQSVYQALSLLLLASVESQILYCFEFKHHSQEIQ